MKKITDERLKIEMLKITRITFIFQTFGILAIVIYTEIAQGANAAFESPLFFVMTSTGVIFWFLQMRVSADMDEMGKHQRKEPMPY